MDDLSPRLMKARRWLHEEWRNAHLDSKQAHRLRITLDLLRLPAHPHHPLGWDRDELESLRGAAAFKAASILRFGNAMTERESPPDTHMNWWRWEPLLEELPELPAGRRMELLAALAERLHTEAVTDFASTVSAQLERDWNASLPPQLHAVLPPRDDSESVLFPAADTRLALPVVSYVVTTVKHPGGEHARLGYKSTDFLPLGDDDPRLREALLAAGTPEHWSSLTLTKKEEELSEAVRVHVSAVRAALT